MISTCCACHLHTAVGRGVCKPLSCLRRSFIPFGGLKPTLVFIWSSQQGAATRLLIPSCTGTALFWPGENLATRPSPLPDGAAAPGQRVPAPRGSWRAAAKQKQRQNPWDRLYSLVCSCWALPLHSDGHSLSRCPELRAARGAVPRHCLRVAQRGPKQAPGRALRGRDAAPTARGVPAEVPAVRPPCFCLAAPVQKDQASSSPCLSFPRGKHEFQQAQRHVRGLVSATAGPECPAAVTAAHWLYLQLQNLVLRS